MRPYSHQAAVYRLSLMAGIKEPAEVISWADAQLAIMEGYDEDLANLALTPPDSRKIFFALDRLIDEKESHWDALREISGQFYDALLVDSSRTLEFASFLIYQTYSDPEGVPEDMRFLYRVDESLELALEGIQGTMESVTQELLEYLKAFKKVP